LSSSLAMMEDRRPSIWWRVHHDALSAHAGAGHDRALTCEVAVTRYRSGYPSKRYPCLHVPTLLLDHTSHLISKITSDPSTSFLISAGRNWSLPSSEVFVLMSASLLMLEDLRARIGACLLQVCS
jgi:hypothetical protein